MLGLKECSCYRESENPRTTPGGYCEVSHRETRCAGDIGICKNLSDLRKRLLETNKKREPKRNTNGLGLLDLPRVLAGFLDKRRLGFRENR